MNTPEDAKDLFADAQAAFVPVVGAPKNEDVKRLNKAFINALQSIDVPGGAVDLSDIHLSNNNHKAKHGDKMFKRMEVPLKAYDNVIAANVTHAVRASPNASGPPRLSPSRSSRQSNALYALSLLPSSKKPGSSP